MRVRNVMQEQQQIVRTGRDRFEDPRDLGTVLSAVPGPRRYGPIHAYTFGVGAMPLAPSVTLGSLDVDAVVIASNVGEGLQPERSGVVLICAPRAELNRVDGLNDFRVAAECEARPF